MTSHRTHPLAPLAVPDAGTRAGVGADPACAADIAYARRMAQQIARRRTATAADWIRGMLPTAQRVLLDRRESWDGNNTTINIDLVSVRDGHGKLLWFNTDLYGSAVLADLLYDGRQAVAQDPSASLPRMEPDTLNALQNLLVAAESWVEGGFFGNAGPHIPEQQLPGIDLHEFTIDTALVDASALDRAPVVEPAATPLIVVDRIRLRQWLADPGSAAADFINPGWRPDEDTVADLFGCLADELLFARHRTLRTAWLAPRVQAMFVATMRDGDIVFGADIIGGGRVTSVPQGYRQLPDHQSRTGVDAAASALEYAADLINQAYPNNRHRSPRPPAKKDRPAPLTTYGTVDGFDYDSFRFGPDHPVPACYLTAYGHAYFRGPDGKAWTCPPVEGDGAIDWACPQNVADADTFLAPVGADRSDFRDLMNSLCAAVNAAHAYDDAWAVFLRGLDEESGPCR